MKKNSAITRVTAILFVIITILSMSRSMTLALASDEGGAIISKSGISMYFNDPAEAWSAVASTDEKATFTLLEDWVADENGDMGTGKGFESGAIAIKNKEKEIVFDLNGFSIDRGLTEARNGGHVFFISNCDNVKIINSSEEKSSAIKGGYVYGYGGAATIEGSEVKFENIAIRNNSSSGRGGAFNIMQCSVSRGTYFSKVIVDNCLFTENRGATGGAIYLDYRNELRIYDSVITGNYAKNDAGIHTEVLFLDVSTIYLGGKVIIADNISENDGEGLMLDESLLRKVYVKYNKSRPLDKESRIVVLSKTDDDTLRITADSSEHYFECYEYENDDYKIIKKGSGSDKYLDIKKN